MDNSYLIRIKSNNFGVIDMVVKYNEYGDLISCELRSLTGQMSEVMRGWLWQFAPKLEAQVEQKKETKGVKVYPIEKDLSFDTFWDLYDYKVGNKKRAKLHWNKLDDGTRIKVLAKVKEYNFYLQHVTIGKVFAERFLGQRRYENEFNIPSK